MRAAAFLLVLAAPLAATGEDWESRCRELAGGSPASRRAAQEALRRAGPEAAAPIAAAASGGDPEISAAAALVVAARRWDPENRLVDLEPLRALDSGSAQEIAEAFGLLVATGSFRTEACVNRVLAARPEPERANLLGLMAVAPPRDTGWARVAVAWVERGPVELRLAASKALRLHGNWRESVDLKHALSRETERAVLADLWQTAIDIARGPEDLPPLPEEASLRFTVLSMMAADARRPRMVRAAWESWTRRRSAAIPQYFAQDAPRLLRHVSVRAFEAMLDTTDWNGDLAPGTLNDLAESRKSSARMTSLARVADGAEGFTRAAALLDDPDNELRGEAEEHLSNYLEAWWDDEPRDRVAKLRGLARAARASLDSAAGLASPAETSWAAREILSAGRASSAMATLAVAMLVAMGPDGRDAILELESDPDLGAAAANARRAIELHLSSGIEFEEGLDSRPWLDWYSTRVPWQTWKRLAASPDPADRWYASSLAGSAWDDLDRRPELRESVRRLIADDDSDVAEGARNFARWRAPELLPEEEELRSGEAWTRPRGYTLVRLRKAADQLTPLGADAARSIAQRGDRALVLKAAWADRFATDDLKDVLFSANEPGLLRVLLRRFESLEVTNWPVWCSHATLCGPEGCRAVAAVARSADLAVRGYAIAALMMSPWGAEWATEALCLLAAERGDDAEAALLYAVQNGGLAWRPPLPRAAADALASAAIRQSESSAPAKARLLVQAFGAQALRNATPSLLKVLAADPALCDWAVSARAWIGDLPDLHDRMLQGPTWQRLLALELLPGNRITLIRCMLREWVLAGHFQEQVEPYRIHADWQQLSLVLLDEAAADEASREALLDLHAQVGRYTYGRAEEDRVPSMRATDGSPAAEFTADSYADRVTATWTFRDAPSPEGFVALSAAAFRGATGDDVALDAIASRLGPDALPALFPLLGRPDPLVRASGALAISRAAGPQKNIAIAALQGVLEGEPVVEVRLKILAALARLGDTVALARLREFAGAADPDARLQAARTLPCAPTRASAAILAALADDADAGVREEAVSGLISMTRREYRGDDPPFGRAAKWLAWLEANPGAGFRDPVPARQDPYDYYDW